MMRRLNSTSWWRTRSASFGRKGQGDFYRALPSDCHVAAVLLLLISLLSCRSWSEEGKAQETVWDYLTYLNQGRYAAAADLYGGAYDVLADWNPDMQRADHAGLLERGCTINGLQCLPVAEISERRNSDPGVFLFYVSFKNPDGTLLELALPDDEQSTGQTVSSFPFTVLKSDTGFKVQELPVYIP